MAGSDSLKASGRSSLTKETFVCIDARLILMAPFFACLLACGPRQLTRDDVARLVSESSSFKHTDAIEVQTGRFCQGISVGQDFGIFQPAGTVDPDYTV